MKIGTRITLTTVTLVLLLGGVARGDLDRSQYKELPDAGTPMPYTIRVDPHDPDVSDETRKQFAGQQPTGEYDLYVDAKGNPTAIDVVRSIPGCDKVVSRMLLDHRTTMVAYAYVRHLAVTLTLDSPGAVRPRNVPPHVFDTNAIVHDYPHLPDDVRRRYAGKEVTVIYYVTVGIDGDVTAVEPVVPLADVNAVVIDCLRHWKFKTQPTPIRSMLRFVFSIPRALH
jgi:hypothetical protein